MTGYLASYQRDGYVVIPGVVDAAGVAGCREHLGRLRNVRPVGTPVLAVVPGSDVFLDGLASDPRLSGLASALLTTEAVCFGCTYMLKDPLSGPPALWHQDGHPWRSTLGIAAAVTLWIALDDVDADNGALQVIPGSHRLPAQPLVRVEGEAGGMFGVGTDEAVLATQLGDADAPAAVRVLEMAAGDVSAHHPWLVHASGANRSRRARRALALRYRPAA